MAETLWTTVHILQCVTHTTLRLISQGLDNYV